MLILDVESQYLAEIKRDKWPLALYASDEQTGHDGHTFPTRSPQVQVEATTNTARDSLEDLYNQPVFKLWPLALCCSDVQS